MHARALIGSARAIARAKRRMPHAQLPPPGRVSSQVARPVAPSSPAMGSCVDDAAPRHRSSGARKRLRRQLDHARAVAASTTTQARVCPRLHDAAWPRAWFCDEGDMLHAQAEVHASKRKGTGSVLPLRTLTLVTCDPGSRLLIRESPHAPPIVEVDRTSELVHMSPHCQHALRQIPLHIPLQPRGGDHAYLGFMGMRGWRQFSKRLGPYYCLPCTDACLRGLPSGMPATPPSAQVPSNADGEAACHWHRHATHMTAAVAKRRHLWRAESDYKARTHLKVPPHYCVGEGMPAAAFTVDFWAEAHVDQDSDLVGTPLLPRTHTPP